jgi:hypothetical protein
MATWTRRIRRRWPAGADYGAMSTQTPLGNRESEIGNRESDPPFSRFLGGIIRFPIPDSRLAGNRESGNGPFPDSAGTGNRGPGARGRGRTPGVSEMYTEPVCFTHYCTIQSARGISTAAIQSRILLDPRDEFVTVASALVVPAAGRGHPRRSPSPSPSPSPICPGTGTGPSSPICPGAAPGTLPRPQAATVPVPDLSGIGDAPPSPSPIC